MKDADAWLLTSPPLLAWRENVIFVAKPIMPKNVLTCETICVVEFKVNTGPNWPRGFDVGLEAVTGRELSGHTMKSFRSGISNRRALERSVTVTPIGTLTATGSSVNGALQPSPFGSGTACQTCWTFVALKVVPNSQGMPAPILRLLNNNTPRKLLVRCVMVPGSGHRVRFFTRTRSGVFVSDCLLGRPCAINFCRNIPYVFRRNTFRLAFRCAAVVGAIVGAKSF
jgi:hypothetical protein